MDETTRRRKRQIAHNEQHGITPQTIARGIADIVGDSEAGQKIKDEANSWTPTGQKRGGKSGKAVRGIFEMAESEQAAYIGDNLTAVLAELEKRMFEAAENLEFEEAARLRDEIQALKGM